MVVLLFLLWLVAKLNFNTKQDNSPSVTNPCSYLYRGNFIGISLTIVCLSSLGCSQHTINSAGNDAERDADVRRQDAKHMDVEAKPDLLKLGTGARVTAALKANQNLPSTIRIDADTDGVRLKGSVHTGEQNELASKIARETLSKKYGVENDLDGKE